MFRDGERQNGQCEENGGVDTTQRHAATHVLQVIYVQAHCKRLWDSRHTRAKHISWQHTYSRNVAAQKETVCELRGAAPLQLVASQCLDKLQSPQSASISRHGAKREHHPVACTAHIICNAIQTGLAQPAFVTQQPAPTHIQTLELGDELPCVRKQLCCAAKVNSATTVLTRQSWSPAAFWPGRFENSKCLCGSRTSEQRPDQPNQQEAT